MKKKQQEAIELEAELIRLNTLVRARRKTLARLAVCPNKDCECRKVWKEQVEQTLAGQVGKIRRQIGTKAAAPAKKSKARSRKS